jgi:hypothetical protein
MTCCSYSPTAATTTDNPTSATTNSLLNKTKQLINSNFPIRQKYLKSYYYRVSHRFSTWFQDLSSPQVLFGRLLELALLFRRVLLVPILMIQLRIRSSLQIRHPRQSLSKSQSIIIKLLLLFESKNSFPQHRNPYYLSVSISFKITV